MKLIIRPALIGDIGAIQNIYSFYVLHGFASFEIEPPNELEMLERLRLINSRGHPYLVAILEDVVVGYAYATIFREREAYEHTLENSVYVSEQHLERGVGVRLLEQLIEECISLGCGQLIAVIGDSKNHPSIRLHNKCGFRQVGVLPSTGFKHSRWIDTVLMQRSIGEGDKSPPN